MSAAVGLVAFLAALVLLLLLYSAATTRETANVNDPCDRSGPLLETITAVVAGVSTALAIAVAVVSLVRYGRLRECSWLLRFAAGLGLSLVLGASFAYMLVSLVEWGNDSPCNGPRFDHALTLFWPTTALATGGALAMSLSALRCARRPSSRHVAHLMLSSAFTGVFLLCAWWMITVLGSAD